MKNLSKLTKEIKQFNQLCYSFYNYSNGIYPIATKEVIEYAVMEYVKSKPLSQIYFDSFDREEVRTIIQPSYKII
jgi:hypothetical protein